MLIILEGGRGRRGSDDTDTVVVNTDHIAYVIVPFSRSDSGEYADEASIGFQDGSTVEVGPRQASLLMDELRRLVGSQHNGG